MKLLFSNYLGDCSYSFQGFSELICMTVTVSMFSSRMQLQERNPPQEFSRIWCNYSYMIEWLSNLKCKDFEKNGISGCRQGIFREFRGIVRAFSGCCSLCPFWVCPFDPSKTGVWGNKCSGRHTSTTCPRAESVLWEDSIALASQQTEKAFHFGGRIDSIN